ncbi:Conserved_hypothetical protein [Hexamita inflata]|uniref:Uncharacterized protein n=1 Tax=Hexamita inflata TaxID=28002 RepID=A0AA86PCQ6_9EUKA|nr:Conserved hypothetical protein [Hexamita inflata]
MKNVLNKYQVKFDYYCGYQNYKYAKGVISILNAYTYKSVICGDQLYVQCFENIYKLQNKNLVHVVQIPNLKLDTTLSLFGMIASIDNQLHIMNNNGQMYIYNQSTKQLIEQNGSYKCSNFHQYCDQVYLYRALKISANQNRNQIIHFLNSLYKYDVVLKGDEDTNIIYVPFSQGGCMCVKSVYNTQSQIQIVEMVPDVDRTVNVHLARSLNDNNFRPILGDTGLQLDKYQLQQMSDIKWDRMLKYKQDFQKYASKFIINNKEIQKLINFETIIAYAQINKKYITKYNQNAKIFNQLCFKIRSQTTNIDTQMLNLKSAVLKIQQQFLHINQMNDCNSQ